MAKSGKSWKRYGKVARSDEKWLGEAICGFMWLKVAKNGFMWLKVAKSGFMWFKVCTT